MEGVALLFPSYESSIIEFLNRAVPSSFRDRDFDPCAPAAPLLFVGRRRPDDDKRQASKCARGSVGAIRAELALVELRFSIECLQNLHSVCIPFERYRSSSMQHFL